MRSDLPMHTDLKDEDLIQRVQAGDESAFITLMSRYTPRVWKVVVANSRQRRDAEEILMDVWKSVWENISGLRSVERSGDGCIVLLITLASDTMLPPAVQEMKFLPVLRI